MLFDLAQDRLAPLRRTAAFAKPVAIAAEMVCQPSRSVGLQ
jgi:hypothetical protein